MPNTVNISYQNLRCHPSMGNQTHSPRTKSLGKGSYHDCQSPLHRSHHRKEGSQINCCESSGFLLGTLCETLLSDND